jgi:dihydroflavonol-4-reductase
MLNGKKPIGNARVIYKNVAEIKDLGIEFNPVILPLTDFNN